MSYTEGGITKTDIVEVTVSEPEVEPVASTPSTIIDIQESDGVTSIVDLTATTTQYINKVEAGTSILVSGIAGPGALVKVYIGSATTSVAAGEAELNGFFEVVVTASSLGVDEAKTLYTTATEADLEESASSNVVNFTLDTTVPTATLPAATGTDNDATTIVATFSEDLYIAGTAVTNTYDVEASFGATGGATLEITTAIYNVNVAARTITFTVANAANADFIQHMVNPDTRLTDVAGNAYPDKTYTYTLATDLWATD
ncbi:hypothetical protein ES708_33861 [subsurface metagenome]